ncbi:Tetratricopeptide repeat-containing protein [Roseateles sp. YR242]|uniref:C39 family peptidase n=1 Tax=Roseateles sp. YR242 TaxID=1855305 RepID=UPI0008AFCF56|nr:tetratricopeptide repeat protein [Roseateles sp. YR242]SEK53890.1 Tetratricopeptide repeat-containing protein [Roseateles sp. YR242]
MKNREGGANTRQGSDWSRIDGQLDRGLYLQLNGELDQWLTAYQQGDVAAGMRAVRALRYLGAERQGDALALRIGRRFPDHPGARVVQLRQVLSHQGPFAYWRAARRWPLPTQALPADASPAEQEARADALSLHALWLSDLRDFNEAMRLSDQALQDRPGDPWLHVERSYVLVRQDRYQDALAACDQALALCPGYRAATQHKAHLLTLQQRQDEAVALLATTLAGCECGPLAVQLADLHVERGQHEQVLAVLAQAESLMPRLDKLAAGRLAARRADALLALGRQEEARVQAALVPGKGFYADLAVRLEHPPEGADRVLLRLPFVRQHWATCAPATLTSLSQYWGWAAEHLEVAQAICYDGTTDVNERLWAQGRGFHAREFRLDWPTACALLDAGIPFALMTQFTAGGHLQAVVGYDRMRNSLLIRDPFMPHHAEFEADAFFKGQAIHGPRALLILPPQELHRIEGLTLPEAEDWDVLHRMQAALDRHDRDEAVRAVAELRQRAPDSRLYWRAYRQLAGYDGNDPALQEATDALLAMFPDDVNLKLSKAGSLQELAGQQACERYLESVAAGPLPDPLLLSRLADLLSLDSRRMPRAWHSLRRALRRAPAQGRLWWQWATFEWNHGDRQAALQAYRWSACLMPTDESAARSYMRACRVLGQTEVGLDFLRERERVWGDRSSAPLMTLHEMLDLLERGEEAEAVLQAGLARRPDDAPLRLFAAEERLRRQRLDEAEALLQAATQPTKQASVLRVRALLAQARGQFDEALACAQEAGELEPFVLSHHRLRLTLLSRREGKAAAQAWLRELAARHPAHYGLHRLLYEWMPDQADEVRAVLNQMREHHPHDGWLRREIAVQASRQGRHDEALAEIQAACEAAPERAESHASLGYVLLRRDGYDAAAPAFRQALRLDADHEFAMRQLIGAAPDTARCLAATDAVAAELQRQVVLGDGWLSFQAVAWRGWPAPRLARFLFRALRQRPDGWEVWVALARQWVEMGRGRRAHRLLSEAVSRFPLLPRLRLELAEALRMLGDRAEALQVNAQALAMSPGWNQAVRLQAHLLVEHQRNYAEAERVIQRGLQHSHDDDDLIGLLGWIYDAQMRNDEALAEARRSLLLNPRPDWIWGVARRACERGERLHDFDALVAEVVQSRPGDAWAWAVQAEHGRDDEQALVDAQRAIELDPRLESAWQARFERLSRLGRFAEIESLVAALPWPDAPPVSLRAWHARCAWQRGDRQEAIQRLRGLVAEAPHLEQLWRDLADWQDTENLNEAYLESALAFQRLAPHRALSQAYVGHALVKLKRFEEALPPLRRAVELEPAYNFAVRQLCLAAAQTQSHDDAEWALQQVWPHAQEPAHALMGVAAARRAGNLARALQWLDRLSALADSQDMSYSRDACDEMVSGGWGEELRARQLAAIERGDGPPGLAVHWLAHEYRSRGYWRTLFKVRRLLAQGPKPVLMRALIEWLADQKMPLALQYFVSRHDATLRSDPQLWGVVSYALLSLEKEGAVVHWMRDWRDQPRAPVWALGNLCAALASKGQWQHLADVVRAALPRAPYQEDIRLWQLVTLAEAGDGDRLAHQLARRHEWSPDAWMQPVLTVLETFASLMRERGGAGTVHAFRQSLQVTGHASRVGGRLRRAAQWQHTPWRQQWRWWLPL